MTASEIPDFLRIEIHHADGVLEFDPNGILQACIQSPSTFDALQSEGALSAISGAPGLIYKTDQVRVGLTSSEIQRLTRHALMPEEYFALRRVTGSFFEIHDDFYDPHTGEALQPMG